MFNVTESVFFHATAKEHVKKNYSLQQENKRKGAKIKYSPLQKQTGFARKIFWRNLDMI
jgi:hypothetical protein